MDDLKEILKEIKSKEIKLNEIKSKETKSKEIKSKEIKSKEIKKRVILSIDDMLFDLRQVSLVLEDSFEMRLAKSGDVALSILATEKIDLILLDIEMPEMSGFDFLQRLNDEFGVKERPPVIFLTSHATPDLIAKAKRAGAISYILKPFDPAHLRQVINEVLDPFPI